MPRSLDDPNLVSRAGLVPVMALASRAGPAVLVEEHAPISRPCGMDAARRLGPTLRARWLVLRR